MLKNYIKIALRNITRNRLHASLNMIGLSMGIAITLLIMGFIWSEWRVNRTLRNSDRQYILTSDWKDPNLGYSLATIGPLPKALKEEYPALVANYYRFDGISSNVAYGDKHFRESIQIGDSTLLTMYGFPLVHGDPRTALHDPFTILITTDIAIKYFGRTDVVGQALSIDNFSGSRQDFRITGVMSPGIRNSVTRLNEENDNRIIIPSANLAWFGRNMDWSNSHIAGYVELQKGVSPDALKQPIARLLRTNTDPSVSANLRVLPIPLTSYYLKGQGGTVMKMIYTLAFIAFFILLMAVINFINLSISRSSSRMKEIGIRKVLGGMRRELIRQFLVESVILSVIATVFGLLLYTLFTPFLSNMLGKEVPGLFALPAISWLLIPVFSLTIGCLAGAYPAFLLSSLRSVDSLKGRSGTVKENIFLRKALVGFQFATATVVFIGAIIVGQQIRLFFSNTLGYDKEYIVSAQLPRDWTPAGVHKMQTVRDLFAGLPAVKEATLSFEIPDGMNSGSVGIYRENGDSAQAVIAETLVTDRHYAAAYQIPMAAGVFFNAPGESDVNNTTRVVINETACRALGWNNAQAAIGRRLNLFGSQGSLFSVSGVVRDFHFGSMSSRIEPSIFIDPRVYNIYRYLSIKLRPGNIPASIDALQRQWSALLPGAPFEYRFMDNVLRNLYQDELRLRKAASAATLLSLVIVLLGVVGLLALSMQKRKKEIAIRKVIGASMQGIIRLFLREFLPVIGIAGLAASPLAWWVMQHWLDDYATRIRITPWPFVLAVLGLGLLMTTLIIVQTAKAALENPVKSLKAE